MLNLSNIVSRIKFKLGIATLAVPFADIDQMITKIIQDFTVPVFSLYCPDRRLCRVELNKAFKMVNRVTSSTEYLLPDFENPKLLYVNDVYYNEDALTNLGYYAGTVPMGLAGHHGQGRLPAAQPENPRLGRVLHHRAAETGLWGGTHAAAALREPGLPGDPQRPAGRSG